MERTSSALPLLDAAVADHVELGLVVLVSWAALLLSSVRHLAVKGGHAHLELARRRLPALLILERGEPGELRDQVRCTLLRREAHGLLEELLRFRP